MYKILFFMLQHLKQFRLVNFFFHARSNQYFGAEKMARKHQQETITRVVVLAPIKLLIPSMLWYLKAMMEKLAVL
jgi:hypothetical protein